MLSLVVDCLAYERGRVPSRFPFRLPWEEMQALVFIQCRIKNEEDEKSHPVGRRLVSLLWSRPRTVPSFLVPSFEGKIQRK